VYRPSDNRAEMYAARVGAAPGESMSICPGDRQRNGTDGRTDNRPMLYALRYGRGRRNKPSGGHSRLSTYYDSSIFQLRAALAGKVLQLVMFVSPSVFTSSFESSHV